MLVAFGAQHVVQRRLRMPPRAVVVEGGPGLEEGDKVHLAGHALAPSNGVGFTQWPCQCAALLLPPQRRGAWKAPCLFRRYLGYNFFFARPIAIWRKIILFRGLGPRSGGAPKRSFRC